MELYTEKVAFIYQKKENGEYRIIISPKQVNLPGYSFFKKKVFIIQPQDKTQGKVTLGNAHRNKKMEIMYHPTKGYILFSEEDCPDFSAETHQEEISILEA